MHTFHRGDFGKNKRPDFGPCWATKRSSPWYGPSALKHWTSGHVVGSCAKNHFGVGSPITPKNNNYTSGRLDYISFDDGFWCLKPAFLIVNPIHVNMTAHLAKWLVNGSTISLRNWQSTWDITDSPSISAWSFQHVSTHVRFQKDPSIKIIVRWRPATKRYDKNKTQM